MKKSVQSRSSVRSFALGRGACRALVLSLAAACAGAVGCGAERDPIDQVQAGVMPKEFFIGKNFTEVSDDPEFYFRTTVVDVSAGAGAEGLFTNSDSQPTVRMRWEITENFLVARLAYELVDGTDARGTKGPARGDEPRASGGKAPAKRTPDGQVVASFAIRKHFDIRRDYNPSTGEENNVILENDVDRPWYSRSYIRVDWSKNLVTDAYDLDATSQLGFWGGVKWDPVAFNVTDPSSPDAPVLDLAGGYLDVTSKALAAPQMIHDEEYGDFPACYLLGSFPRESCNPSEVTLRLSFRKVVDSDYEALDYDGRKMDLFGLFTNDRFGYDRRYGVQDERWHRFAARWNIWEKSHASPPVACNSKETTPVGADVHRDDDRNGTEDECEAVGQGSRCDEFRGICTLPLRARKVKPVVWYTNRGFPEDLFEGSRKTVETWSDAARVGVVVGRLAECRRTGGQGCEDQVEWPVTWSDDYVPPFGQSKLSEVPRIFVLCHNPVDPSRDDPACGKEPISPRLGDLRYNFFSLIESPQLQSPWGIMMDAEDPLTGEKIAGSVNQWSAVLDKASAQLSDLVALLNGEILPDAYIKGQNVSAWVRENARGGPATLGQAMSADERRERLESFDPHAMDPFFTGTKPGASTSIPAVARHKARMAKLAQTGKLGVGNAALARRLTKLRGTDIEAQLTTPEMVQAAGQDPKQALTPGVLGRASPFKSSLNPMIRRALEARERTTRARRHSCRREAPESNHLLGLAHQAQILFGPPADPRNPEAVRAHRDQVYQWARQRFSDSVFSHEFGHAVGLRHNFAGSFDSLNYADAYWQLRTRNGTVTAACKPGTTDGSGCIGPRYNDPITLEEINGQIAGFASSSVMDYPGDEALDMLITGKYDRAAMRFVYGGTVDVWSAPDVTVKGGGLGQRKAYELTAFADSPGLFGVYAFPRPGKTVTTEYIHYSQYASEFGLLNNCKADPASPLGTRCQGAPLDVVDYRDMQDFASDPLYAQYFTSRKAVDALGRPRRGYMFSSDEFSDSGNVPSFSYDAGADAYEQVRFLESSYENRYVLDAFRRGRTQFNSEEVVSRVQSHYLDAMQNISKTFGFAMVLEVEDPANPPPSLLADGNYGPLAMASSVTFDLFARNLTRPEPGSYCSTAENDCPAVAPAGIAGELFVADSLPTTDTKYSFALPLGQGRYVHNDFDYDQGYWWSDYQNQVGSFYDKVWSIYYLTEAFDTFISNSKEDFVDGRYKNVNFATVYPSQMRRLLGTVMTGDLEAMAPWTTDGTGNVGLVYPSWRNAQSLGVRPARARLVDPTVGWNQQLYAMVWGTMLLPGTWTQDFIDDARIVARVGEQITWPAAETYTFVDPATNTTFRARTTGTEKLFGVDRQKSVGARMLEWANSLVTRAYLVEKDATGAVRLNPDGTPRLLLKDGKPQVNPDGAAALVALKRYVTNIEVMRQLVTTFMRPLESSLPEP